MAIRLSKKKPAAGRAVVLMEPHVPKAKPARGRAVNLMAAPAPAPAKPAMATPRLRKVAEPSVAAAPSPRIRKVAEPSIVALPGPARGNPLAAFARLVTPKTASAGGSGSKRLPHTSMSAAEKRKMRKRARHGGYR